MNNLLPAIAVLMSGLLLIGRLSLPTLNRHTGSTGSILPSASTPQGSGTRVIDSYGKLPLSFEANQGQADSHVKFMSRGSGYSLVLTSTEAVFRLRTSDFGLRNEAPEARPALTSSTLRMKLIAANPTCHIEGLDQQPGRANYFIGSDPAKWHTNIPTYTKVKYRNVYAGIDLAYYGNERQLEYDFIVAPGADFRAITLGFEGADRIQVDGNGDLLLDTAAGEIRQKKPFIYQEVNGVRHTIAGRYALGESKGQKEEGIGEELITHPASLITFEVGDYDPTKPLIIDPVLVYSTYLGGSGPDRGLGISVDMQGNAYVTGETSSPDFVGGGSPDPSSNIFVVKIDPTGNALVYSAVIGGRFTDRGSAIAVDSQGNAYVAGETTSSDFPTVPPPPPCDLCPPPSAIPSNGFVLKLDADGSTLEVSRTAGGSGDDRFNAVALGPDGSIYVAGETDSPEIPTLPNFPSPSSNSRHIWVGMFVDSNEGQLYKIGGDGEDRALGLAVDSFGNVYVAGETSSRDFPQVGGGTPDPGAFPGDPCEMVAMKLNPTLSTLIYSRVIGGNTGTGISRALAVAVGPGGVAYLTGETSAPDFPVTPGAIGYAAIPSDPCSIPVVKLNADGSIGYAALIGGHTGSGISRGFGILGRDDGRVPMVDQSYIPMIVGETTARDFAQVGGGTPDPGGYPTDPYNIFAMKLNPTLSTLIYSRVIGGNTGTGISRANGVALDSAGDAYLTGETTAIDFPTASFDHTYNGGPTDAFVLKLGPAFNICLLYDPTKAHRRGSTIPIKLQLCDASGNLSSSSIVLTALSVQLVSSTAPGSVEDSGSANPDDNFRYEASLGGTGGYIFNLSTRGLATGTYNLNFKVVGSDPTIYSAPLQVK
jgi:hypothetical protein